MTSTLLNPDRVDEATERLDDLISRAAALRERYGDRPLFAEVLLCEAIAADMGLHRVNLAELIALAAVRLAEQVPAVAPVSPAGPYCQGCRAAFRPGDVHVCREHRTVTG